VRCYNIIKGLQGRISFRGRFGATYPNTLNSQVFLTGLGGQIKARISLWAEKTPE
jgi:hypothetical protein